MSTIFRIAKKEFASFFSSPIAFIFIGVFLAVTLFVFFWVEKFFVTNVAEVRPLFSWMPILLIFLTAAVTMRMWAEERRAGTLEFLLTAPVSPLALVLGKFLACLTLVALALVLTLGLPITVSLMGPLDWGPVAGGYLASLFLAAAYLAIGLYVSVKSETQIVSLITTSLVCALFYLIGSDVLVGFFGNQGAEILQLLGSGSRFSSITRGVIDLRDLVYYLAIMGIFISLNVYALEQIRWANNPANVRHRTWQMVSLIMIANFVVMNLWLAPVGQLRVDLTKGGLYSISDTTRNYLRQLKEPLLIRGYFSAQTHPLLAPLVPRIRDLLAEYAVAGGSRVHVEFIDPTEHPELEQEAGQKYGIRPVPFQVTSKYQAAVTNSYFDLLIQYGDQYEVLGFRDLIEVKVTGDQEVQVDLRNPEYDITRSIKKALFSYQGGGDLFSQIDKPVTFTTYFSPDAILPEELITLKKEIETIAKELVEKGGNKFTTTTVDPDGGDGSVAQKLMNDYGFRPMALSILDTRSFWFYMTLNSGDRMVEIPLPEDLSQDGLRRAIEAGLKRFGAGFAKTIALSTPQPPAPQYGMMPPSQGPQFSALKQLMQKEHGITETDLSTGRVPEDADMLMVLAPQNLDEKQLFALDQFLMQGGTVVLGTSPFTIGMTQSLNAIKQDNGLAEWLSHHGISLGEELVMDPQNTAFPVPVQRKLGAFTVEETKLVNYPYFVDVRQDGMNTESQILSGLDQMTITWSSPITIDGEKNGERQVTRLLESSPESWLSTSTVLTPDFQTYGEAGFGVSSDQASQLLAVAIEGKFSSFFAGKPSPLAQKEDEANAETQTDTGQQEEQTPIITRQLDHSSGSARIILVGSATFASDEAISISSSTMRTSYFNPVQLLTNMVDWSLEDRGLLSIRGRGHFSRTLMPMSKEMQMFWEYCNYGLALFGLILVWLLKRYQTLQSAKRYRDVLAANIGRA